jgi:two-component system, NtrC family, sensor histidine kinase PilS
MKPYIPDFLSAMPVETPRVGILQRLHLADNFSTPESYWRSLTYFNIYRGLVALVFFCTIIFFHGHTAFGSVSPRLFLATCAAYFLSSLLFAWMIHKRFPAFPIQLQLQVLSDIVCLVILMYASGGIKSGVGLMLLISMMAAGLVSRGRIALFHAAAATICVLFVEFYRDIGGEVAAGDYVQSAMLSSGFFVTAWLAHTLAKYSQESAQLAARRGKDLINMAQVNQLVIQDLSDGVLVIDGEGGVRSANTQAENYLGSVLTRQGVKLRDVSLDLAMRLERWRLQPLEKFSPFHAVVQNVSLETRFVSIGASEPKPAVIFLRDVSRQQNAAQQIKLAALGRLTASIAHEIRNPLSSINHAAELLQEGEHVAPTDARLLQIIRDNSLRLDRMVQEVLNLNRREHANPEAISPKSYLSDFIEDFSQVERIPKTVFSLEIETDKAFSFDRTHLNQVLWNLTRNAWRHCQQQDHSIRFCFSNLPMENMLQLDIIDDGPGVDPALQDQLFEPFFTTESQGTGLGLYIAREVCEANGGRLEYVSVAPGGQFRILMREA